MARRGGGGVVALGEEGVRMRHPCPVRVWVTWCGLFELCTLSHVFGLNNELSVIIIIRTWGCVLAMAWPPTYMVGTFGVHAEFTSLNRKKSKPDVCYSGFSGPLLGVSVSRFPSLAISATAVVITVPVRGVVWAFWKGLSV